MRQESSIAHLYTAGFLFESGLTSTGVIQKRPLL
jgi:hypothetical protein